MEDDDTTHEVILAIDVRDRDTIGCCYYVTSEECMYFLNDAESGELDIVARLKTMAEPSTILLSPRVDETVGRILNSDSAIRRPGLDGDHAGFPRREEYSYEADQYRLPYVTEVLPSKDFDFEESKRKLAESSAVKTLDKTIAMAVPGDALSRQQHHADGETGLTAAQNCFNVLATMVDLDSHVSVGCASAVLGYLERCTAREHLPIARNLTVTSRVNSLRMFNLDDTMYINKNTLMALQIIDSESHPHVQNLGPNTYGSKESLSVYGLFHHLARTPQGKRNLRQAFLRPSLATHVILQRHNSLAVFLRSDNESATDVMIKSLKSIKNMRPILAHLRKGMNKNCNGTNVVRNGIWTVLRSFAFHTLEIFKSMYQIKCESPVEIMTRVLASFDPHQIARIGQDIITIIDFKTSIEENRTIINPGIDEGLDSLKRTYAGIDDLLSRLSNEVIKDFQGCRGDFCINVVTYPQIGFLVAIQRDSRSGHFPSPPWQQSNDPWERIFSTEDAIYYKDSRMRSLDRRYGDIAGHIYDKEIEITFELGQRVLKHEKLLCQVSDVCGELDFLLALTKGARVYNLRRPELTAENIIHIEGGRHILQEQMTSSFMPNDTSIAGSDRQAAQGGMASSHVDNITETMSKPNMLIVTGPNSSGKSTYLKQVALVVFLSQVGSFVPADKATLGITDKILTRISTRETVSRQQSAFMTDCQQIALALKMATPRTLCVVDEFGKGTNLEDGAGLMYAVLKWLSNPQQSQPKVLVATHFLELFESGLLRPSDSVKFAHMGIVIDAAAAAGEKVVPLYKLKDGRTKTSLGIDCAAMNGMPATVLKNAKDIWALNAREALFSTHRSLTEADLRNLRHMEDIGRRFLSRDFKDTAVGDPRDKQFLEQLRLDVIDEASLISGLT